MFKATDLFEHMQRYTREVFAERMRKEGFSSYKGHDIHWYRLVNNEVIQAVYFVAFDARPCTFAGIQYGCHPLFIPPIWQKSPLLRGWPDYVQASEYIPETIPGSTTDGVERLLLCSEFNNRPYRMPDSLIMCSPDQHNGLDVLEKLLAVLNRTTTPRACYELHSEIYRRIYTGQSEVQSVHLVDEILYLKEEGWYPDCREFVKARADQLEYVTSRGTPVPKIFKYSWEHGHILNQVFEKGELEEYLNTFQDRIQHNLRMFERNTGKPQGSSLT